MTSDKPLKSKHIMADCAQCSRPFSRHAAAYGHIYCSLRCSHLARREVERPAKEELAQLVETIPAAAIARRYGVAGTTVGAWCRVEGLKLKPRGYWTGKQRVAE